jgi:CRISPR-associated protein Cas2
VRYVVAYDIEDDRVRLRVAKVLGRYGVRVQKSVFECALDAEGLTRLTRRLERELEASPGNVRIYRTCADCLAASLGVGDDLAEGMAGEPWIVV